ASEITAAREAPSASASQHLLDECRDVVPLTVQHRPNEAHPATLERSPRPLDIRNTSRICLDHDDCGIELRPDDERIAVHVDRREIDDDEVEVLAELCKGPGSPGESNRAAHCTLQLPAAIAKSFATEVACATSVKLAWPWISSASPGAGFTPNA